MGTFVGETDPQLYATMPGFFYHEGASADTIPSILTADGEEDRAGDVTAGRYLSMHDHGALHPKDCQDYPSWWQVLDAVLSLSCKGTSGTMFAL